MPLHPCQSCRSLKIRCNREVPHCQACVRRGKLCVYEMKGSDRRPALSELRPNQQKQVQEGEFGEYQITWKVQEPQTEQPLQHGTSTAEAMHHVVGCADDEHIQHLEKKGSKQDQNPPYEILPKVVTATVAEEVSFPKQMALQLLKIFWNGLEACQPLNRQSRLRR